LVSGCRGCGVLCSGGVLGVVVARGCGGVWGWTGGCGGWVGGRLGRGVWVGGGGVWLCGLRGGLGCGVWWAGCVGWGWGGGSVLVGGWGGVVGGRWGVGGWGEAGYDLGLCSVFGGVVVLVV